MLKYHGLINNKCNALKFTIEFPQEKIIFLDVLVLQTASGIELLLIISKTRSRLSILYQFLNLVLFSRDEDFQDQWGLLSKGLKNEHIEKNGISLLRVVSHIAYMSQQVSLDKK